MQKFGFENRESHGRLFEVMEGANQDLPNCDIRESIMEEIQGFLDHSYFLGINPLRGLRKILPQYQWRFYRIQNEEQYEGHIKEVVSKSDFIWKLWYDEEDHELVTATKLDRPLSERLKYFWAGSDEKKFLHEQINFIESFGCEPVHWGLD